MQIILGSSRTSNGLGDGEGRMEEENRKNTSRLTRTGLKLNGVEEQNNFF